MFKNLKWKQEGIKINRKYLNNQRFADDVIIIATSNEQMQKMINDIYQQNKNIGLDINDKKSLIITNGRKEEIKISPKGNKL